MASTISLLLLFLTTFASTQPSPILYRLLPRATPSSPPFKLEVHSANPALNNRFANVCNLQFWVGENARTCTYCYNAPPQFVCERYGNQTVLLVGGVMSVDVPGSQYWFVDPPTGRLRTTGAGKAAGYGREFAGKGVTVYEDGYFEWDGWDYWLACRENGGRDVFAVFAPLNETVPGGCEKIKLVALTSTEPKEGAYSYA